MFQIIAEAVEAAEEIALLLEETQISSEIVQEMQTLMQGATEAIEAGAETSVESMVEGAESQEFEISNRNISDQQLEANQTYIRNGHSFETDENGKICKQDGEPISDIEADCNDDFFRTTGEKVEHQNESSTAYTDNTADVTTVEKSVDSGRGSAFDSGRTSEQIYEAIEKFSDSGKSIDANSSEVFENTIYYADDLGNIYRVDDDLVPNNTYEVNGYMHTTDAEGRIVSSEGNLRLSNTERARIEDSAECIGKGDQLPTDDRGHQIGARFDGSNGMENLVPQDFNLNRGAFKSFEDQLAKHLEAGDEVYYKIENIYDDLSRRPESFNVTYSINGETFVKVFKNIAGG